MNSLLCILLSMGAAFTPRRIGLTPPQRRVAVGAAPSQSARLGHYVPSNPKAKAEFIKQLRRKADEIGDNLVKPVVDLVSLVKQDPNLQAQFTLAFARVLPLRRVHALPHLPPANRARVLQRPAPELVQHSR